MLSKKLIEEYRQIVKEEFGVDITYSEAHEQATNLINYFKLLLKIENKNKKNDKRTKSPL